MGRTAIDFHYNVQESYKWSPINKDKGDNIVLEVRISQTTTRQFLSVLTFLCFISQDHSDNNIRVFWGRVYPQAPIHLPSRTMLIVEYSGMEQDKFGKPAFFKSSIDVEYPGEIPPFLNAEEVRYVCAWNGQEFSNDRPPINSKESVVLIERLKFVNFQT